MASEQSTTGTEDYDIPPSLLSRAAWLEDDDTVDVTSTNDLEGAKAPDSGKRWKTLDEQAEESMKWSTRISQAQRIAGIISHFLAVTAVAIVCVWISDEAVGGGGLSWKEGDAKRVFNWHPVMMVTAFAFMTVAALAFRMPWKSQRRKTNKFLHGMEWTVAAVCGTVGLVAVFKSHNDPVSGFIANMYSLHSWIGCSVLLLYLFQFFAGVFSFGVNCRWIGPSMKAKVMFIHQFVGPFIYNLTAATILLGIQEKEGFMGCGYEVTKKDTFPPAHFSDMPGACRVSHTLGLIVLFLSLSTTFAMHNFGKLNTDTESRRVQ